MGVWKHGGMLTAISSNQLFGQLKLWSRWGWGACVVMHTLFCEPMHWWGLLYLHVMDAPCKRLGPG